MAAIFVRYCYRSILSKEFCLYDALLLYYGIVVAIIGVVNFYSLILLPKNALVNVDGLSACLAAKSVLQFSFYYIAFPVMLIVQRSFSQKNSLRKMALIVVSAACISAMAALFQKYVDPSFLHFSTWAWKSYGGLATDPNGLALTIFLVLAFVAIGIRIGKNVFVRFGYAALLALLIIAEWVTRSRTGAVGIILFLSLWPVLFSISAQHWHPKLRIAVAASPFVLAVVICLFLPTIMNYLGHFGGAAIRLSQTWDKYERGGISSVFQYNEPRARLFHQAVSLIEQSPWVGWGPGGFYREHPNLAYQEGVRYLVDDSPLNHFLMIACDIGMPMMLLNLVLIIVPSVLGAMAAIKMEDDRSRFVPLALVVSNVIFLLMINTMPPSYFLGALWVWTAQLALLISIAERHHVRIGLPETKMGKRMLMAVASIVALVVMVGSYHAAFGANGYQARLTSPWWMMSNP